jgi:hypothetical protein
MATAQGVKMDTPAEVKDACEKFRSTFVQLKSEIGKVVVGHSEVVEACSSRCSAGGTCCSKACRGWARRSGAHAGTGVDAPF